MHREGVSTDRDVVHVAGTGCYGSATDVKLRYVAEAGVYVFYVGSVTAPLLRSKSVFPDVY